MKRFHTKAAGFADHTNATLLDLARWILSGEHNRPTEKHLDKLSRIKVGGTIAVPSQGWSITRVRDQ